MQVNVREAIDANVLDTVDTLRDEAAAALSKYVALKEEIAHLEAVAELRKASGATLTPIRLVRSDARD